MIFPLLQYNLDKIIGMEMKGFFDIISKPELQFSDRFKTRDFIHLYDAQKFFLHKSIRRITELIVVKTEHYWHSKRTNDAKIESWEKMGEYFVNRLYDKIRVFKLFLFFVNRFEFI